MLEAKGPGYADKMTNVTTWRGWFEGDEEIEAQIQRQERAAAGRIVEWHFAEQRSPTTSATMQSNMT